MPGLDLGAKDELDAAAERGGDAAQGRGAGGEAREEIVVEGLEHLGGEGAGVVQVDFDGV